MSKTLNTTEKNNKSTELQKVQKKDLVDKNEKNKLKVVENKSIQNSAIENIKNFISKIIDMQKKVKEDEIEEKKTLEEEKADELIHKNEEIELEKKKASHLIEYYDLPYRYNETVVKILAQTPKRLFVYWDIADSDRELYIKAFGENFYYDTYPVLLLHNESKNYTKEIDINDFANSWYIDIGDPRDKYTIQLGRKFKSNVQPHINAEFDNGKINLKNDYLFIAISNKLEVPNDHILFEEFKPIVTYRNVKTMHQYDKKVTSTSFDGKLQKLYGKLYGDNNEFESGKFDMLNPSSHGVGSSNNVYWGSN